MTKRPSLKVPFAPLSALVRQLRALEKRAPLALPDDLAEEWGAQIVGASARPETLPAILLALRFFGAPDDFGADPAGMPRLMQALSAYTRGTAMSNAAELALSLGDHLVVHQLRPSAVAQVAATDLHALPRDPPRLLAARGCLVEVDHHRGERLFGETVGLGAYPMGDGRWALVGLRADEGVHVAVWRPAWGEREILRPEDAPLLLEGGMSPAEHTAWGQRAARLLVVLGLLLEAENTPLRRRDDGGRLASGAAPPPGKRWTSRTIDLAPSANDTRAPAGAVPGASGGAGTEGRLLEPVAVRGHLKQQPHGPGGSLRKTLYIAGYAARRWVAPEAVVRVR